MTGEQCPNPMEDWEGYLLWSEMNACPTCEGLGILEDGDDELQRDCPYCDGTGIDPAAVESIEDVYE